MSKIDPTVIEDLDLELDCRVEQREEWRKPKLRIKINAEKCTFGIRKEVEEVVSRTYNLQKYALYFKGIKEGCIELIYHISRAVVTYLLQCKITGRILTEFSACKVISIYVNDVDILVSS